jgi:hypothetical protein
MSQSNVFQVFMATGVQMKVIFGFSTLCSNFIATERERADRLPTDHLNISTFHRNILQPSSGGLNLTARPNDEVKKTRQLHKKVQENWTIKAMKEENHWPHITQTQALKRDFGEFSSPHWLNQVLSPLPLSVHLTRPAPSNHPTQPRSLFC